MATCTICPHRCNLTEEGQSGICLTRKNINGKIVAENYMQTVTIVLDPIEKKPLYHYMEGKKVLSIGANGCNFKCSFCQNHTISQAVHATIAVDVDKLIEIVKSEPDCIGVAYTFTEPTIWYETVMEIAPKIREAGLKNIMVTNGYMEVDTARDFFKYMDAVNIDIKFINEESYRRVCKGSLTPVLRTCIQAKNSGVHVEISHVVITNENDDLIKVNELTDWIVDYLGKDTPLHLCKYYPAYMMKSQETDDDLLLKAWLTAKRKLSHVYLENMSEEYKGCSFTYCEQCGVTKIERDNYKITKHTCSCQ